MWADYDTDGMELRAKPEPAGVRVEWAVSNAARLFDPAQRPIVPFPRPLPRRIACTAGQGLARPPRVHHQRPAALAGLRRPHDGDVICRRRTRCPRSTCVPQPRLDHLPLLPCFQILPHLCTLGEQRVFPGLASRVVRRPTWGVVTTPTVSGLERDSHARHNHFARHATACHTQAMDPQTHAPNEVAPVQGNEGSQGAVLLEVSICLILMSVSAYMRWV